MIKNNGVHIRWGAATVIVMIIGIIIGTFINPVLGKIESNERMIHNLELNQSVLEGTIMVQAQKMSDIDQRLRRIEDKLDKIIAGME